MSQTDCDQSHKTARETEKNADGLFISIVETLI